MSARQDRDLARHATLRLADLPGPAWLALPAAGSDAPAGGAGEVLLDRCLGADGDLLLGAVTAAADSARFVRPAAAMAYGTAVVLRDEEAAGRLAAALATGGFARCFAEAVAADVAVAPGGATLLGAMTRPVDGAAGAVVAVHRATFSGGAAAGVVPVHVDLAVVHGGRAVVLVWLADSPDPFADAGRAEILRRVAGRLPAAAG